MAAIAAVGLAVVCCQRRDSAPRLPTRVWVCGGIGKGLALACDEPSESQGALLGRVEWGEFGAEIMGLRSSEFVEEYEWIPIPWLRPSGHDEYVSGPLEEYTRTGRTSRSGDGREWNEYVRKE